MKQKPASSVQVDNSELIAGIRHPEALKRLDAFGNESSLYGCDQNMYRDPFKQKAGCGPCAATNLLDYSRQQHQSDLPAMLLPDFIEMMHQVWNYVKPGLLGVHKASQLADGIDRYAAEHNLPVQAVRLEIPASRTKRPSEDAVIRFLSEGLNGDSPIAFLNRSNGQLADLESWHWVTITALHRHADGHYLADIANYGIVLQIDLSAWLCKTRLGGGFVYFRNI